VNYEGRKNKKMEKILKEDLNQIVYEKLKKVARAKTIITYSELGRTIGLGGHDPKLWRMLDEVNRYEHQQGRPMLSVVVNIYEKNAPGEGFFKLAHQLSVHQGSNDDEFFNSELCKVYDYWSSH